jgi:hypothetical protein
MHGLSFGFFLRFLAVCSLRLCHTQLRVLLEEVVAGKYNTHHYTAECSLVLQRLLKSDFALPFPLRHGGVWSEDGI